MTIAICQICGKECIRAGGIVETLVAYISPSGHDHDDNCKVRQYICPDGHVTRISKQNRCPVKGCDWVGEEYCTCHPGKKVKEWPEVKNIT